MAKKSARTLELETSLAKVREAAFTYQRRLTTVIKDLQRAHGGLVDLREEVDYLKTQVGFKAAFLNLFARARKLLGL